MDFNKLAKDQSQEQLQELTKTFGRMSLAYYYSLQGLPTDLQNSLTEIFTEVYLRWILIPNHDQDD